MRLYGNAMLNLGGQALPVAAALACIPPLLARIGPEKFGALALIWAILSISWLLDIGSGKALTRRLTGLEEGSRESIALTTSSFYVAIFFSAVLMAALWLFSALIVDSQKIETAFLGEELVLSCRLIALSMPILVLLPFAKAVLEARGQFVFLNLVRGPINALIFVAPLLVAVVSTNIVHMSVGLIASRALMVVVIVLGRRRLFRLTKIDWSSLPEMRRLIAEGGWFTVATLVGGAISLGFIDRIQIGRVSEYGLAGAAVFVTGLELAIKLWIVPQAILSVLFVIASRGTVSGSAEILSNAVIRSTKFIFLICVIPALIALTFSSLLIGSWVGGEIAENIAEIFPLLITGSLINSLAHVPMGLVQATGLVKYTAVRHLVQVIPYCFLSYMAAKLAGPKGCAVVYALWCVIDHLMIIGIAWYLNREVMKACLTVIVTTTTISILLLATALTMLFIN